MTAMSAPTSSIRRHRWTRRAIGVCGLLAGCKSANPAAVPAPLRSATPPLSVATPNEPRRVTVVLIDSLLTNDVLRGAIIEREGATGITITNADGVFTLDSMRAGRQRVLVRHPLLDSLGLDALPIDVIVRRDSSPIMISLPTPGTLFTEKCSRGSKLHIGDGLILGIVRDAETDQPVSGIEVLAAWRGIDSTFAGGGNRARARVRTNAQGQYLICRAPRFTPVELWVRDGERDTPRVRTQLGAAIFGAFDLSVNGAAASDSSVRAATGSFSGRILMLNGDGLPNATVELDRVELRSITDSTGRFIFVQVPAGVRSVEIRALGFKPSRVGLNLRSGQRIVRDITLDRTAAVLGEVVVRADRSATWDSLGFVRRRALGGGYFFTKDAMRGIADLSTALRGVPGIRGRSSEGSQRLIAGRGAGCYPAFVVNGVRFAAGGALGPEAMIRAEDVRAMEVYTSRLSTPAEHQRFGDCAVIVIWLRDPQAEREARKP